MTDGRLRTYARLQVLAAAILFSTGGAAVKATALDGWQVAGLRSGIAALFLFVVVPQARRGWSLRMLPTSLAFSGTLLLFVLANKLTTAANTVFLVATAPLYVLVLSPLLLGERLRRRDGVLMVLIAVGMAVFFMGIEPVQATAPNPSYGNLLAAGAGLAWALTVIGLRRLSRDSGKSRSMPAVVMGNCLIFAVCLPRMGTLSELNWTDGLAVSYLGVIQIGLAYVFLTAAMRRLPALEASLLIMAEPVLSPVWAWWFHGEAVGPWALVGGGVILAATALPGLYDAFRRSTSDSP